MNEVKITKTVFSVEEAMNTLMSNKTRLNDGEAIKVRDCGRDEYIFLNIGSHILKFTRDENYNIANNADKAFIKDQLDKKANILLITMNVYADVDWNDRRFNFDKGAYKFAIATKDGEMYFCFQVNAASKIREGIIWKNIKTKYENYILNVYKTDKPVVIYEVRADFSKVQINRTIAIVGYKPTVEELKDRPMMVYYKVDGTCIDLAAAGHDAPMGIVATSMYFAGSGGSVETIPLIHARRLHLGNNPIRKCAESSIGKDYIAKLNNIVLGGNDMAMSATEDDVIVAIDKSRDINILDVYAPHRMGMVYGIFNGNTSADFKKELEKLTGNRVRSLDIFS